MKIAEIIFISWESLQKLQDREAMQWLELIIINNQRS